MGYSGAIPAVVEAMGGRSLIVWILCCVTGFCRETWSFEQASVWAREQGAVVLEKQENRWRVEHKGSRDWSLGGFPRIAVQPGDVFEIGGRMKAETSGDEATVSTGVVVRDAGGRELDWCYGGVSQQAPFDWKEMKSRFVVPQNAATIEPRVIGSGALTVTVETYAVERTGNTKGMVHPNLPKEIQLAGEGIRLNLNCKDATMSVTDNRTGRTWTQAGNGAECLLLKAEKTGNTLDLTFLDPSTAIEFRARVTMAGGAPELLVEISGEGALPKPLDFPQPFTTRPGDRLIIPVNEGMGYPVNESHEGLGRMIAYGGHGICMGFFGVAEDPSGAGWMCLLETPDDAAMNAARGTDGLWRAGPSWDACRGGFGYPRKVRYVFFDKGGHVAMCKRYREHAKQTGLHVPFTEKVKRNPNIDRLIGAANIWRMGGGSEPVALVREMQALGMDRLLWSAGGTASEIKGLREMPGVLVGRYDIYQDIMDPANHAKIGYVHGDWVTEAFPHDINWRAPNGDWRRGWEVKAKDGSMIPCAVICDSKALPYARKRISNELREKPYTARFIDTTVAAPWFECYHPDHPMTRSQSRRFKMDLLKLIGESGLVCGSETGHDAAVPFCDYFEGMLSLGPYRVPDSGRDMARVWHEVPERVAKYQLGENYRLPLWELVYHDCVVAQWYWGDYNNKLPALWRKRDLFNALYGTPPMYLFDAKDWPALKSRIAASYKVAQPVSRATGYAEMSDHRFLTKDRTVQQTRFANGVEVTVNFGGVPFQSETGRVISPMDLDVRGIR